MEQHTNLNWKELQRKLFLTSAERAMIKLPFYQSNAVVLFPQSVPVPTVSPHIPSWMLCLSPKPLESLSIDELDCTCKEQWSEGIF